jgi:putative ABC transport system permease protein
LRAILTIAGIVVGPATIVALNGATQGYSNAVVGRFETLGANTLFVTPVGRGFSLTPEDLLDIQNLAGVGVVLPYHELAGRITQGGQSVGVQVVALDLGRIREVFPTLTLAEGTEPGSSDLVGAAIGNSIAYPNIQGATNVTLNQVLTVSDLRASFFAIGSAGGPSTVETTSSSEGDATSERSFVVRGVYAAFGQGFAINPDQTVFIPLAAGQALRGTQSFSGVIVVASSTSMVSQVITELTDLYGQSVRILSVSSILSSIESVTQGTQTLLEAVGGTSVLVAFIGIMTTMLTSVVERTREIGVLKAVGSTSRGIITAFVTEATIAGFVGGVLGAAIGYGLSFLVVSSLGGAFPFAGGVVGGPRVVGGPSSAAASASLSITPAVSPEILLFAIVLATAVGAIGGLVPAWRASRLPVVEALHRS